MNGYQITFTQNVSNVCSTAWPTRYVKALRDKCAYNWKWKMIIRNGKSYFRIDFCYLNVYKEMAAVFLKSCISFTMYWIDIFFNLILFHLDRQVSRSKTANLFAVCLQSKLQDKHSLIYLQTFSLGTFKRKKVHLFLQNKVWQDWLNNVRQVSTTRNHYVLRVQR